MTSSLSSTDAAADAAASELFPPLTKGFELEFLALWRLDTNNDGKIEIPIQGCFKIVEGYVVVAKDRLPLGRGRPTPSIIQALGNQAARRAVYDLLRTNGVEVYEPDDYFPRTNYTDVENEYAKWKVKDDGSTLRLETTEWDSRVEGEPYNIFDIELISPVFQADDQANDAEMSRIVQLMKSKLLFFVPKTCGYHHHIGQGSTGFDIVHLRKIATVLYVIEAWFNGLHPEDRQRNPYCRSVRKYSLLAEGSTAAEANADPQGSPWLLRMIPGQALSRDYRTLTKPANAWKELDAALLPAVIAKLMHVWNRGAYNFSNITNISKPTIEFRQAAGTLNEEWIVHWSSTVVRLVDWARRASDEDIRQLLVESECKDNCREEFPGSDPFPLDAFLRNRLGLTAVADYVASTTAATRATPKAEGQQKLWRESIAAQCHALGDDMLPEIA